MGNLAKGSPLIKKINFFCFLLDTSRVSSCGNGAVRKDCELFQAAVYAGAHGNAGTDGRKKYL